MEEANIGKFLAWAISIFAAMAIVMGPKELTLKMANLAVKAQHDQMSYGKFSRVLWGNSNTKAAADK